MYQIGNQPLETDIATMVKFANLHHPKTHPTRWSIQISSRSHRPTIMATSRRTESECHHMLPTLSLPKAPLDPLHRRTFPKMSPALPRPMSVRSDGASPRRKQPMNQVCPGWLARSFNGTCFFLLSTSCFWNEEFYVYIMFLQFLKKSDHWPLLFQDVTASAKSYE